MSKQEFEVRIELPSHESINLSEFEDGDLWISIFKVGCYASANINKNKVIELRDALNQFLGEQTP